MSLCIVKWRGGELFRKRECKSLVLHIKWLLFYAVEMRVKTALTVELNSCF